MCVCVHFVLKNIPVVELRIQNSRAMARAMTRKILEFIDSFRLFMEEK